MTEAAYPLPAASTVRQLYGSAFRCAHPECSRPLYKVTDDTGDLVLNSRVAHIHARRKGGPRWLGMPAGKNRAFENLLLLCIEHSYEIDETPERFPADMLREWKAAQISENERLQRNWTINDNEAAEALVASEALGALHAPSTVELVRRVEALRLVANRTRATTRSWALRWQQLREQTRRSFTAWDDDGNPVYAEPAATQVAPMREGIRAALAVALGEVGAAADAARVELAAVRATRVQVRPWCEALDRDIRSVVHASSNWSGGPHPAADSEFDTALSVLERSISDLVRASRGEAVAIPEVPPTVSEPVDADPLAEHRELLDEARPFHRVHHRTYDAELRARVADATHYAAAIPPTVSLLPFGLDTTAALAVAVAGNASEDEQLALVEQDRHRLPACAAVALLQETARRGDEQTALVIAVREQLRRLWSETDWTTGTAWIGNETNGQAMMYAFARVTSDEEVRSRLTKALKSNPGLLETLVIACAGWVERLDSQTWDLRAIERVYRELPPWLPTEAIRALAMDIPTAGDMEIVATILRRVLRDVE